MILGFTGTRKGMTLAQLEQCKLLLFAIAPEEVHHGDCVGADEQFHRMVDVLEPRPVIVGHPPSDSKFRAYCTFDRVYPAEQYLVRNVAIVDATHRMLATPNTLGEVDASRGSGTWSTIRYARKLGRPIIIIYPDGHTVIES